MSLLIITVRHNGVTQHNSMHKNTSGLMPMAIIHSGIEDTGGKICCSCSIHAYLACVKTITSMCVGIKITMKRLCVHALCYICLNAFQIQQQSHQCQKLRHTKRTFLRRWYGFLLLRQHCLVRISVLVWRKAGARRRLHSRTNAAGKFTQPRVGTGLFAVVSVSLSVCQYVCRRHKRQRAPL